MLQALSEPAGRWDRALRAQVKGAIAGGVDVVQFRERGLDDRDYLRVIRAAVAAARGTPTRIVVNDRVDLALAAPADGVHLREDSIPVDEARRLTPPGMLIGRSVHDAVTAARIDAADYLIAGPVFETVSKPGRAALGLEGVRDIVRAAGARPVWAVGGIEILRARELAAIGVQGVAAIGAFLPTADCRDAALAVQKCTEALRVSFDSGG